MLAKIQILCRLGGSVVCVHPQLSAEMCRMLGIPSLQDVVSETLDVKQPLVFLDALDVGCKSNKTPLGLRSDHMP